MKQEPFLLKSRLKSFKYAINGILAFIKKEHNAWIHLTATILVIILSIVLKVNTTELIFLSLVTGLVWISEMINTVIEKIMDYISSKKSEEIKFIKDASAGVVLIAALIALITGCAIFIPKI